MYSNFLVSKNGCMTCNNQVLKTIGTLRGVFGAEIDRIDGSIVVNHTDEVSRAEIAAILESLGWNEIQPDSNEADYEEPNYKGCEL